MKNSFFSSFGLRKNKDLTCINKICQQSIYININKNLRIQSSGDIDNFTQSKILAKKMSLMLAIFKNSQVVLGLGIIESSRYMTYFQVHRKGNGTQGTLQCPIELA